MSKIAVVFMGAFRCEYLVSDWTYCLWLSSVAIRIPKVINPVDLFNKMMHTKGRNKAFVGIESGPR